MHLRHPDSLNKPALPCSDAPRLRCRDPRCQCALPEPAEHRQAFCARGCYTHFYRTRCKVCGEPSKNGRLCSNACRYAHRQNPALYAFRAIKNHGMAPNGFNARARLTSPYKTGLKARAKSVGPTLSDDEFWLATLPLHSIDAARVKRANEPERIRRETSWIRPPVLFGPDTLPLNLIGGWRFPDAPPIPAKLNGGRAP